MLINIENKVVQNTIISKFFEIIIFFCIPIIYIVGSLPVNFILIVSSIYIIFLSYSKKIIFDKKEIYIFLIIMIFLIINSLSAEFKSYSLYKSMTYFRFILFLYFGIYFLNISSIQLKRFFSLTLLGTIIFVSFDSLVQFIYGIDLLGYKTDITIIYGRLSGPFGSEYIVGSYLFCFGFVGFACLKQFFNIGLFLQIIYVSLLSIMIFLTGERNAILCTILSIFILFLINKNLRSVIILSALIIILSCNLILKNSEVLSKRYSFKALPSLVDTKINKEKLEGKIINKLVKPKSDFLSNKIKIINNSIWFSHYRAGIRIFKKNIFIGSGFKSFRHECIKLKSDKKMSCASHPHNMYIELISDTGLVGFLSFACFVSYIIFIFFKNRLYKNDFESILFAVFLAFIFPIKPHGSIFSTNNAFMIWYILTFLMWGFFYKINYKKKK